MKDSDFQQLLVSVREAGRIKRGELESARKFEVRAEDVKAIRAKLNKSQSKSVEDRGTWPEEARRAGSM